MNLAWGSKTRASSSARAALDEPQPHSIGANAQRRSLYVLLKIIGMQWRHVQSKQREGHEHASDPNRQHATANQFGDGVEFDFAGRERVGENSANQKRSHQQYPDG